ncbi:hypothetical protein HELRODRAFT_173913 [Helobdella robusta]|uniref:Uncharacterized protein n=1 Tax=Helobdella robusta TaxID=6412 RepID=T1F7D3_HELRO|nr:hypothetical protein HELRODRAFT_173913 [Helobdella robusta]ESO03045.1 hypothetical protein HELRODRAFT_173913 [Helobdella robusta]
MQGIFSLYINRKFLPDSGTAHLETVLQQKIQPENIVRAMLSSKIAWDADQRGKHGACQMSRRFLVELEVGTSESESLVNINNELKLKGNEKNVSSLAIPKDNFDATCSKTKKDIANYVDVKLNNHEKIEARDLL